MFTGIIESLGRVKSIDKDGTNLNFRIVSNISTNLKVDQSLNHNGVCLTVVELFNGGHVITAVEETLNKSNLGTLRPGDPINLERCMIANGRFDGHIVQGHVDQTGKCEEIKELDGSWQITFSYDDSIGNVTVEKGSICVNGLSLTCFNSDPGAFAVAIIPYTFENTNMKELSIGDSVNLEFDIVGKYIQKLLGSRLRS